MGLHTVGGVRYPIGDKVYTSYLSVAVFAGVLSLFSFASIRLLCWVWVGPLDQKIVGSISRD